MFTGAQVISLEDVLLIFEKKPQRPVMEVVLFSLMQNILRLEWIVARNDVPI